MTREVLVKLILFALAVFLMVSLGIPAHAATVVSTHPRFLVYADSIATIRSRLATAPWRANFITYCDARLARNWSTMSEEDLDDVAAAYVLTGDTKYSDSVIWHMRHPNTGYFFTARGSSAIGRADQRMVAYDWCYDQIPVTLRDSIIVKANTRLTTDSESGWNPTQWTVGEYKWIPAYITWGDNQVNVSPDAVPGVQVPYDSGQNITDKAMRNTKLDTYITYLDGTCIPCLDEMSGGGSSGYYPAVYFSDFINFMDCVHIGVTSYGGTIWNSTWWQNAPRYWAANLRADVAMGRTTGRYNSSEFFVNHFMSFFANRLQSADAAAVFDYTRALSTVGTDRVGSIIWEGPTITGPALSTRRKTFVDDSYGYYRYRSGWTFGTSSTDLQAFFSCGPNVEPELERTQGMLTVTRGGTDLLISAGWFKDSADQHWVNYGAMGGSRNIPLIYDATESMVNWLGGAAPNDGGQVRGTTTGSTTYWPHCGGTVRSRGSADTLATGPSLLWGVLADASLAYATSKVSMVKREVRMPVAGWILVQDLVKPTASSTYTVSQAWHTLNMPTIDGSWTNLDGAWPRGGIFSTTDRIAHVDRARSGYSSSRANLYFWASSGTPELRMVGGRSSYNGTPNPYRSWVQNVDNGNAFSYTATYANQSYECWTGGLPLTAANGYNRSPSHDSFAAADTASTATMMKEPHSAGQWRLEWMVPSAPTSLTLCTLIQVGASDISTAVPTWTNAGGWVQCEIAGIGAPMILAVRELDAAASTVLTVDVPSVSEGTIPVYVSGLDPGSFTLSRDGTVLEEVTTDANGQATFNATAVGGYTLIPVVENPCR